MSATQSNAVARHPAAESGADAAVPSTATNAAGPAAVPAAAAAPISAVQPKRKVLRRVLMLGGVVVVLGGASFMYLTGGRFVGTDDAYVKAAQLSVTTDVSGVVASVDVKEGQRVKKGDVLFRIDAQPFENARANAEAAVAQARMSVGTLQADYRQALQQVRAQQAQVDLAKQTLDRYEALVARGAIARTLIDQQRATYISAIATLDSLRQSAAADLARLAGNPNLPAEQFPEAMKAAAALHEAQRQIEHTVVRAPFDGVVTAVGSLQPGALIISAMSAFSTTSAVGLVSEHDLWIEANMKETDLTRMHAGQPVDIHIDSYPECSWMGSVDAIAAASGSAFSPLPAQNTSGNWVKVVQRIPVRVKFDKGNCDGRLSTGMSATVSIDTGRTRWQRMNG